MTVEDAQLFEKIKKKYNMNNEEVLSFCVNVACRKIKDLESNKTTLEKILEYVMLLVKVNKELPTIDDEERMKKVLNSTSRFEELIENKIKKSDGLK